MKKIKKIAIYFFGIVIILNAIVIFSGNQHLYKGIVNTYLKGKKGPDIDEYQIFENRKIASKNPQPLAVKQTSFELTTEQEEYLKNLETTALFIVKNDSIVFEKYCEGYNESSVTNVFSAAKSVVSMLIGAAIKDGLIQSVNQKAKEIIPEYEATLGEVTIKELLQMTSGINFDESYTNPFAFPAKAYYTNDLKSLMHNYQPKESPGTIWKYKGGDTQFLAFILEKVTGKTVSEYAQEKLWKPLGMNEDAYWSLDDENGVEKASCCINSNPRDFAKLGLLMLKMGNYNGQQIIDSAFVKESITPVNLPDENNEIVNYYGYQWWIYPDKSETIFYARGILGQYLIVIPSRNLVMVRFGKKREKENIEGHPKDFFEYIKLSKEF